MNDLYLQVEYLTKWGERLIIIWNADHQDGRTAGTGSQNMTCRHVGTLCMSQTLNAQMADT